MNLQKIKVTVEMEDGVKYIYDNITSIYADDKLSNANDVNSQKIFTLNIDSLNVIVKKDEPFIDKNQLLINKIKEILKEENNQNCNNSNECCNGVCDPANCNNPNGCCQNT